MYIIVISHYYKYYLFIIIDTFFNPITNYINLIILLMYFFLYEIKVIGQFAI